MSRKIMDRLIAGAASDEIGQCRALPPSSSMYPGFITRRIGGCILLSVQVTTARVGRGLSDLVDGQIHVFLVLY